jgi:hypothetical protein
MTTKDALNTANEADPGERLRRYDTICAPHGGCRREPLVNDPSQWTWCPDCLTLFDYYGKAVNELSSAS